MTRAGNTQGSGGAGTGSGNGSSSGSGSTNSGGGAGTGPKVGGRRARRLAYVLILTSACLGAGALGGVMAWLGGGGWTA